MKNVTLLIGGDAFDLQNVLKQLDVPANPTRFVGSDIGVAKLEEALFAQSLFGKNYVVIEEAQDLKAKALDCVLSFVKQPSPHTILIMQATKKTELAKHVACVEIAEIKPWDRQGKMAEWIIGYVNDRGLKIQPQLAHYLASFSGYDRFFFCQELEKLFCYIGDKTEITKEDCKAVCTLESEESLWVLSEAFLQKETARALKIFHHLLNRQVSSFVIIRTLRNACHQALLMCSLAQIDGFNVSEHFPQLKGSLFEKNFKIAKGAGADFLTKALLQLDKTEHALKDSPFDEETLLTKLFL